MNGILSFWRRSALGAPVTTAVGTARDGGGAAGSAGAAGAGAGADLLGSGMSSRPMISRWS